MHFFFYFPSFSICQRKGTNREGVREREKGRESSVTSRRRRAGCWSINDNFSPPPKKEIHFPIISNIRSPFPQNLASCSRQFFWQAFYGLFFRSFPVLPSPSSSFWMTISRFEDEPLRGIVSHCIKATRNKEVFQVRSHTYLQTFHNSHTHTSQGVT